MSDIEQTRREAETAISQVDELLQRSGSLLERSESELGSHAEAVKGYIAKLPSDKQAEIQAEIDALSNEIERDLPKQQATRPTRIKPTRQMV